MDEINLKKATVASFLVPGIFPNIIFMVEKYVYFDIWNKKIALFFPFLAHCAICI